MYLNINDGLITIIHVIRSFLLRAIHKLERPRELTIRLSEKNIDYNYSCRNTILTILIFIIGGSWGTSFFYYNEMHMQHEQKQINSLLLCILKFIN